MKYQIGKYDKLPPVIWEKRDLVVLFLAGLMLGFLLATGIGIWKHESYLDARCRMGLLWHDGKQYEVTEVLHGNR